MLTNEDWCIPAGANSRRYFMLEASPKHANDREYFKPLFDEIDKGGAEAMLHELLHRKIVSNLRFAPETAALLKQREQSLSNLDRWVLEAAKSGAFTKRDGTCLSLDDKEVVTLFANDIRDAAKHYCGNDLGFNRTLGPLLLDLGVKTTRPRADGKQVPSYVFPKASEFRASVKTRLNIDVDVNEAPSIEGDESEFIRKTTPPGNQREGVRMLH